MSRRVGIMGGTFDPIHIAHLVAAEEAASTLGFDEVRFIPARQPPHKRGEPVSDARHRLAMTRLAVEGNPRFTISTIEMDREGPSYTVDTLRHLAQPGLELAFIVGMDSLVDLSTWHDPEGILALATIVAVSRGGIELVDLREIEAALPAAKGRVEVIPMPSLDISSTDIRRRVAEGRSIRYLVPDPVIAYIASHDLYRD